MASNRIVIAAVFMVMLLAMGAFIISLKPAPVIPATSQQPYTYLISTNGTYYYAYDSNSNLVYGGVGNTGGATGTSFSSVLNAALTTGNEKVVIQTGNFIIDAPLSYSVNNVVLEGLGSATNLTLTAAFNAVPLTVLGQNWIITQIRFDARNIVLGNSLGTLYLGGSPTTGFNITASLNYFSNGDHGQIQLFGTSDRAMNNLIVNSHDDAIIVRGDRDIVDANTITTSVVHNGISLVDTTNAVVENNFISGVQSGIRLEVLTGTGCKNTIVFNNVMKSLAGNGIVIDQSDATGTNTGWSITSNYIDNANVANSRGIDVAGGSGTMASNVLLNAGVDGIYSLADTSRYVHNNFITIANNFVNNSATHGIFVQSDNTNVVGNTIGWVPTTGNSGIYFNNNANVTANNNLIHSGLIGIFMQNVVDGTINGNTVLGAKGGSNNAGIILQTGSNFNVVGNYIAGFNPAISITGSNNEVSNNNVVHDVASITIGAGSGNIIGFNIGYNPVAVTTFTAGASVYAYTNNAAYDIAFYLDTANGITGWTCDGITLSTTAGTSVCVIPPTGTMSITWATTAPIFKGIPLEG